MELSSIKPDTARLFTRTLAVKVDDETLNVTVRPLGLSQDTQSRLIHLETVLEKEDATAEEVDRVLAAIPKALSETVVSWDLTIDGEPVSTDYETIRALPLDVVRFLFETISAEAQESPKEETSTSSKQ